MLRPLYYLCKVFGLASYSYVADRRNNRVTTEYGYLNYLSTVVWLILYTVGLPVHTVIISVYKVFSGTSVVAFILIYISSHTSSIMAVVWVSIIKKRRFLEIIENISERENKIRYTIQEETDMNRKVMFNIISEIILVTAMLCSMIVYCIYVAEIETYYLNILYIMSKVTSVCNALMVF